MIKKLTGEKKIAKSQAKNVRGKGSNPIADVGQALVCLSKHATSESCGNPVNMALNEEAYDMERLNS